MNRRNFLAGLLVLPAVMKSVMLKPAPFRMPVIPIMYKRCPPDPNWGKFERFHDQIHREVVRKIATTNPYDGLMK